LVGRFPDFGGELLFIHGGGVLNLTARNAKSLADGADFRAALYSATIQMLFFHGICPFDLPRCTQDASVAEKFTEKITKVAERKQVIRKPSAWSLSTRAEALRILRWQNGEGAAEPCFVFILCL